MKAEGQDPADSIRASYTPDMAETIDTLEDQMRERLSQMSAMNPALGLDMLAKMLTQIVEETISNQTDNPTLKNKRDDTLDEAILATMSNRSPESLTSLAARFMNPSTGKPYTRAALSARISKFTKRTGLTLRIQRTERVREIYKERAKRIHERRRKECPKWNKDAFAKGIKKGGKKK